jgi:hypothetical protein
LASKLGFDKPIRTSLISHAHNYYFEHRVGLWRAADLEFRRGPGNSSGLASQLTGAGTLALSGEGSIATSTNIELVGGAMLFDAAAYSGAFASIVPESVQCQREFRFYQRG